MPLAECCGAPDRNSCPDCPMLASNAAVARSGLARHDAAHTAIDALRQELADSRTSAAAWIERWTAASEACRAAGAEIRRLNAALDERDHRLATLATIAERALADPPMFGDALRTECRAARAVLGREG